MTTRLLDYTQEMCELKLASLEQIAYSEVVSALRAQGSFTPEKKKLLQELQRIFHIPLSLHKAEVRRAVNSERLYTIAYRIEGPNTAGGWVVEGKSLCPPIPRVPERTAYTEYADKVVEEYKASRAKYIAAARSKKSNRVKARKPIPRSSNIVHANAEGIELDIQQMQSNIPKEQPSKDVGCRKKGEKRKHGPKKKGSRKVVVLDPSSERSSTEIPAPEVVTENAGHRKQGKKRKRCVPKRNNPRKVVVFEPSPFSSQHGLTKGTKKIACANSSALGSALILKKKTHCIQVDKGNSSKALPSSSNRRFLLPLKRPSASTSSAQTSVTVVNPSKSLAHKTVTALPVTTSAPSASTSSVPTATPVSSAPTVSSVTSVSTILSATSVFTASRVTSATTTSRVTSALTASRITSVPTASRVTPVPTASRVIPVPTASHVTSVPTASRVVSAPIASRVTSAPTASQVMSAPTTSRITPSVPAESPVILPTPTALQVTSSTQSCGSYLNPTKSSFKTVISSVSSCMSYLNTTKSLTLKTVTASSVTSSASSCMSYLNPTKRKLALKTVAASPVTSGAPCLSLSRTLALTTVTSSLVNSPVQSCTSRVNLSKNTTLKTATDLSTVQMLNESATKNSVPSPFVKSNALQNTVTSKPTSSTVSASVVNSLITPLFSVSTGQNLSANSSAATVNVIEDKARSKVLSPAKRLLRTKAARSSVGSPTVLNLSSALKLSTSTGNPLKKTVISLKPHSPCISSNSSSSSSIQVSSASSIFKRPISPIKFPESVSSQNSLKMKAPVTLKYCQREVSESSTKKPVLSRLSKEFPKRSVVSTLGTKTVTQSPIPPKISTSGVITTTTWKSSNSPKILPPARISGSLSVPQKLLTTHISTSPGPVSEHVQFRSGVKIISPNTPSNHIASKPMASQPGVMVTTTTITSTSSSTGITKNAKIINLTRPIKLDRSRLHLYTTPTSASNKVSTSGVRICPAPTISTSSGRPVLPAKPNVIVVHKAQVLPQTPGAAIVMPSSSILTRLSSDSAKEHTDYVPNKGSEKNVNVSEKSKVFAVQLSMASSVSKASPLTSISTNTDSQITEQVLKDKKILMEERNSNEKLRIVQPNTLIERKTPERPSVCIHEKAKISLNKPQVSFSTINTPITGNVVTNLPKEAAVSSKPKDDLNIQRHKLNRPKGGSSLIRIAPSTDNDNPKKKLKLPVSVDDKLRSHQKSGILSQDAAKKTEENDCSKEVKKIGIQNLAAGENNLTYISSLETIPIINVRGLNLNHLQEGETLALQAPDALHLLQKHGSVEPHLVELLEQNSLEMPPEGSESGNPSLCSKDLSHAEVMPLTEFMSDSFEEISCQEVESEPDLKYGIPYVCESKMKSLKRKKK